MLGDNKGMSPPPLALTPPQQQILIPESTLCFTGDRNSPTKRADYTGAFLPECKQFMSLWKIPGANHLKVNLGTSELTRYQALKKFITERTQATGKAPTSLVFFCHGLKNKIQLGINLTNAREFSKFIADLHTQQGGGLGSSFISPVVVLYACSTGSGPGVGGDGGFADKFRDALCEAGLTECRVYGHETSGHTVRNPRKRVFEGRGSTIGGTGGTWLIAPGTPMFRTWQRELAKPSSSLRYRYAYLTLAGLHYELVTLPK